MQQPSNLPQQIVVPALGGVNERVSPGQLKPGEFSYLEGLYPSQSGLLSRVPGKQLLATLPSGSRILQIRETNNHLGDILVQTDSGRFAYTLDELFGRSTMPNLTPGTTPGGNDNEEAMSIAIIYQEEANTVPGGSIQGFISGTDSSSAANTMYPRRLTFNPTNQSSTLVSFTASTGGAGAASTAGQFVLAPGTYRIESWFLFGNVANAVDTVIGLYNFTNSAFQLDDSSGGGSAEPLISSPGHANVNSANNAMNLVAFVNGRFVVTGSNNTFQFNQASSLQANARIIQTGGYPSGITATIVNGAAMKQRYAMVKILKEP